MFKAAVFQMTVAEDKKENMLAAETFLQHVKNDNIDIVVLPEMFICPYNNAAFPAAAEEEGGETWSKLSSFAKKYGVYLAAGSVPERDNGKIYNTGYIFDRNGKQIGKHRKMHLFDINITGGQHFKESDTLAPGDEVTVFDTEFGRIGFCICYDIRFPEIFRLMADAGAVAVIVPGAFNMTTGPAHWEMLFRMRAVDNQLFMIGASPARKNTGGYRAWGHSIIVDPWGTVLAKLDEKEGILLGEIDLQELEQIRNELPLLKHRRTDLYEVKSKY